MPLSFIYVQTDSERQRRLSRLRRLQRGEDVSEEDDYDEEYDEQDLLHQQQQLEMGGIIMPNESNESSVEGMLHNLL